jgi:DNA modification methylase
MAVSQMSDKCPNRAMHNGQAYNEYDDNKSDADYTKLLEGALANCLAHADDAMFNIGILKASKMGIITMMHDFKDKFCDIIVWNKSQSMPLGLPSHSGCVSHRCELIFCFNQDGSRAFSHPQWSHGAQINRIDTENASNNEFAKVHAATFPVALPAEVIKAYTKTSVLDCFGGTGTTMIAAEQLGRKCYMMELDPHYCDVIIARWEKLTGKKAIKLEG